MVEPDLNLKLIENERKYFEFIRVLRNDESLKVGFINQEEITSEQHELYMHKHHAAYFICLLDDEPVGYVGVIENDLRIAVSTEYHNLGIGKFMVSEILKRFPASTAKVKVTNIASQKLFEGMGFTKEFITYRSPFTPEGSP